MNPLTASPVGTHPLDSLTAEEVSAAARILKEQEGLGDEVRFVSIVLHEEKDRLRAWTDGEPVPRQAFIVFRNRRTRGTYEAVVDLTDETVLRHEQMEGVQASITGEEFMATEDTVRASPEWQEAMRRARGRGLLPVHARPVVVGLLRPGGPSEPPPHLPPADVGALGRSGRQRVRAAGRGAAWSSSTSTR